MGLVGTDEIGLDEWNGIEWVEWEGMDIWMNNGYWEIVDE
jgi:hypothetical protein